MSVREWQAGGTAGGGGSGKSGEWGKQGWIEVLALICQFLGGEAVGGRPGKKRGKFAVENTKPSSDNPVTVRDLNSHSDDFNFAQDCVDGKGSSLSCFHQTYHPTLVAFLKARGATVHEAEETAETVLSECMATTKNGRPKLASYQGACSLQTWLNTVAIHSLYDLRRRKTILAPFDNGMPPEGRIDGGPPGDTVDAELDRVPLLALLRSAIDTAFRECDPEDFVLLQLAHCDQLKERELAVMFRCNTGTICRRLQRARESISEVALRRVKETDEHLELRWDDFLDICRFTDQSYFEES